MNYNLTEDQLAIKDLAERFTAEQITPNAAEWDEKHIFPRETIRAAAEDAGSVDDAPAGGRGLAGMNRLVPLWRE